MKTLSELLEEQNQSAAPPSSQNIPLPDKPQLDEDAGFLDRLGAIYLDTLNPAGVPMRQDYKNKKDYDKASQEYSLVLGDVGKGLGSGALIGVPQGFASIGTLAYDYATDSNTTRELDEYAQSIREATGLNPQTNTGKIAELAGLFAVPGLGIGSWLSIGGKTAQAFTTGEKVLAAATPFGKSAQMFGRTSVGQTLLGGTGALANLKRGLVTTSALAVADFTLAPDGLTTISDHFDVLPEGLDKILETEEDTGLIGREDVERRIRNKFRVATEGFLLGSTLDLGFAALGGAARGAAIVAADGTPMVREGFRRVGNLQIPATAGVKVNDVTAVIGTGFDTLITKAGEVPFVQTGSTFFRKNFTTRGLLDKNVSEAVLDTGTAIQAQTRLATKLLSLFDKEVRKTLPLITVFGKGKEAYQRSYDDLIRYLEGDLDALSGLSVEAQKQASRMAQVRNDLSETIYEQLNTAYKNGEIDRDIYAALRYKFEEQMGKYLRRMYSGGVSRSSLPKVEQGREFKVAVGQVMAAMKKHDKDAALMSTRELEEAAKQFVFDNIVKDRIEISDAVPKLGGRGPERATALDKQINTLAGQVKEGARLFGEKVPLFKVSDDLLRSRSAILEASPMVRSLMGEVKTGKDGAIARYLGTVADMSAISSANKLYNSLLDNPSLTRTADQFMADDKIPLIFRAEDMARLEVADPEVFARIKPLFVEVPKAQRSAFGGRFGALGGNFVRKELYDALTIRPIARSVLGDVWATGIQLKGMSQIAKTVFSTTAQIRNYGSGVFFNTANGILPRAGDVIDSFNVSLGKLGNMRDDEFYAYWNLLNRTGVLEDSVLVKEMQDVLRGTAREAERSGKRVISWTEKLNDAAKQVPLAQAAKNVAGVPVKGLQASYALADNVWKTAGHLGEVARYTAALREAKRARPGGNSAPITHADWDELADDLIAQGVAPRKTNIHGDNFFDVWTTDLIKDTRPVYSRIPKIAKTLARFPIAGNFVGFSAEIIRNSFNIVKQGTNELAYKVTPRLIEALGEQGAKEFVRQINAIGLKRLTGYITTAVVTTPALVAAGAAALGIGEDVLETLEQNKPYFYKGQQLIPVSAPKDGKMEYLPISYMAPYDSAVAPAVAAVETYGRGEALGQSTAEKTFEAIITFIAKQAAPFTDEALLSERVADVMPEIAGFGRGGRRSTGAEIYEKTDSRHDKIVKSFYHIMGALNPSIVDQFMTVKPNKGLTAGRITRALTDQPGAYQDFDPAAELTAALTGFRSGLYDHGQALYFNGQAYARDRNSGPVTELSGLWKKRDTTREELINQWWDSNGDLFRLQQTYYLTVKGNDSMDMDKNEALRRAKSGGVSREDYLSIRKGEFNPLDISPGFAREVARQEKAGENRVLNRKELLEIRRQLNKLSRQIKGLPLNEPFPDFDPETMTITRRPAQQEAPVQAPVPAPAPSPTGSLGNLLRQSAPTAPAPAPAPAATPGPQSQISPTLLGDNPIEVARNMELANRRGRV